MGIVVLLVNQVVFIANFICGFHDVVDQMLLIYL